MIVRGLRFWLSLPGLQRRMIVRAVVWLGAVNLALRLVGFQRLMRAVPPAQIGTLRRVPGQVPAYAAALELVGAAYPLPMHCLQKSVVLHFWLRREGIPSELRIGVRKENQQLKAHAWVEVAEQVVNDNPAAVAPFRPLSSPQISGVVWSDQVADDVRSGRELSKVSA